MKHSISDSKVKASPVGPAARKAGHAGGGAAGTSCLVQKVNTVTDPLKAHPQRGTLLHTRGEIRADRCRCRFCPSCCRSEGIRLREALREVIAQWVRGVVMITLTLNRRPWGDTAEGAEVAFDYVREQRCIARFVRRLRTWGLLYGEHYISVMEPHPKSPDWIHWHVLVQADWIDFEQVYKAWQGFADTYQGEEFSRDTIPAFGRVDIQRTPRNCRGQAGINKAVNYVTGYVTKYPACGWPAWLRKRSKVNIYSTSHRFWADHDVVPPSGRRADDEDTQAPSRRERRPDRPILQRVAECSLESNVMRVDTFVDEDTGEMWEERTWLGTLPVDVWQAVTILSDYLTSPADIIEMTASRGVFADLLPMLQSLELLDGFTGWESRRDRIAQYRMNHQDELFVPTGEAEATQEPETHPDAIGFDLS